MEHRIYAQINDGPPVELIVVDDERKEPFNLLTINKISYLSTDEKYYIMHITDNKGNSFKLYPVPVEERKILVCEHCQSANIQVLAWANPNTRDYKREADASYEQPWCANCEKFTSLTPVSWDKHYTGIGY